MSSIPASVLIVRLDAIGDAVTTVPMIAALRRYGVRVGAVLTPRNAGIFAAGATEATYVAHDGVIEPAIARGRFAAALIVTEKPQGYRIARWSGAGVRIGFENGWGKPLKTLWVRRMCTQTVHRTAGLDSSAPHECDVVFKLAQRIIPDAVPTRDPNLLAPILLDEFPQRDERVAIQITDKWERLGAKRSDVLALVELISTRNPTRLIGAYSEREYCAQIERACRRGVDTFESLSAWKSAIAAARGIVAPDSGAVHVAGMIGTPVAACFAAEQFGLQTARWAPWAAPHQVVRIFGDRWPTVAADALQGLLMGNEPGAYTG